MRGGPDTAQCRTTCTICNDVGYIPFPDLQNAPRFNTHPAWISPNGLQYTGKPYQLPAKKKTIITNTFRYSQSSFHSAIKMKD